MKPYFSQNCLKYLIVLLVGIIIQSFFITSKAQEPARDSVGPIQLIARPLKDSIILRWAPVNFTTWNNGNKYGYRVFRSTVLKDTTLIENSKPIELTPAPLKPKPLLEWKELVQRDKYAAISAQAIFGDTFKVDAGFGFNARQAYSKSKEQQLKFSIALYAADLSPEAAEASGLWFVDKTAKANEQYLYSVTQAIPPDTTYKPDTAYVFTGQSKYQSLPQPVELNVKFGDKYATVSWNAFVLESIYIGYFIEKSSDGGKTYTQIHADPIPYMVASGSSNPYLMYKIDSLEQNNIVYYYRIRGANSFGEKGPYSNPISGKGKISLSASPVISKYEDQKGKVKIYWDFPSSAETEISIFKILRSNNDKIGFKTINEKVNRGSRNFVDNMPLPTGYYKIVAWQDSSVQKESFPFLVQLIDSIPPKKPEGLAGVADTSGIVKLTWNNNKEEDIFGYRVFRSVSNKDEYSQLTSWPLNATIFSDTLSKNNLNTKVYYKVMAVDQRQNESEFSKILELKKPDIIPPSSPVFKKIDVQKESITTEWTGSSSNDVKSYSILRKIKGDTSWIKLKDIAFVKKNQQIKYIDKTTEPGKTVIYKLEAIDESANISKPAVSIEVNALKPVIGERVTGLQKAIDDQNGKIKISWEKTENAAQVFWIYRKTSENGYMLYETIPGNEFSFTDKGLKAGNKYYYRVKALYKDDTVSTFSDEISCIF